MAFMIPDTLKNQPDTTAGERKLFDLFKRTLPGSCVVRYEVLLGERHYRPDYTLMDPNRGVLIVEVKDWDVKGIVKATQEQFYVHYGSGAPAPQINPNQKCQIYLRHVRESLVSMPVLRDSRGGLRVSLYYFVAFPNISRQEFAENGFGEVIPSEHVLLREDLARSGKPFMQRYDQVLPELETALTKEREGAVKKALFPDTAIPSVTEHGFISAGDSIVDVGALTVETHQLSSEQEQLAKTLGEGPRLLRGIAGTGKTLIMLYRAKMFAANNEDMRILILCWNTSLANYMNQAYDRLQFEARGQVTIQHFSEFARLFTKRGRRQYDDLDDPQFMKQLKSVAIKESDKYDAIYVDEAQDFRQEWIAFLYHNLLRGEPKERNLLVAADDAQRVYHQRDFRWKDLGIPMVGRSKILKTVYRNSARVWVFSAFLLEEKASYVRESPDRVRFFSKGGYDPQLVECESLEAQIDKAIEIIQAIIRGGYAVRNVLILYRHKKLKGFHLVNHLRKRLHQEGIPDDWIAEDPLAKRTFDWNADTVKISTVHSAKGMDSPVVIVLGAETFRPELSDGEYDETKLMYVALTRAREFLVVLHTGDGGLVPQLRYCQEEYLEYREAIISLEEEGAG